MNRFLEINKHFEHLKENEAEIFFNNKSLNNGLELKKLKKIITKYKKGKNHDTYTFSDGSRVFFDHDDYDFFLGYR